MRKLLALLLAGSMLAGMTAPASADPISTAILTAVGIAATSTAVAVTSFVLSTVASLGLSFLSQALMAKPQPVSGSSSTITFGGACPREICFGTVKTAGQFTYSRGIGRSNKRLYRIFTLSDWECDGLNRVWVDGEEKALTAVPTVGSEHVRYEVEDYEGDLILKFFRGTMDQVADTELLAEIAGDSEGAGMGDWTADHRGAGVCYVIQRLLFDDDLFTRGIPSIQYELRGAKLYDRRQDSTAGGSGAHRFNDVSTWAFSENPVVMDECFRRGFHRNGIRLLGIGQPAGDLVSSYYVAAANACDEALTEGGNPEKRYICSAIISDDAEYRVAIDAFSQSMAGQIVESQGLFAPIAGVAQSSAGTFKETDQLVGFASKFSMQRSRTEKANTVTGTYLDPEKKWEPDSFKTVTDPAWLTADNGEPLTRELQLHMVRKPYQANRIAQIIAKRSRLGATFTGVFGPEYAKYAAGDWVTLEHKRGTFTMQVERRKVVGPLQFEFTLRQIASATMSGAGEAPPIVVIPPAGPPAQAIALAGFNAVPATAVTGAHGQQRPAILVTWIDQDDPGVTRVMIEYRVVGGLASPVFVDDPTSGQALLQADIMASTTYEVRGKPLREPNIETTWSSWVTVKTTDAFTVLTSNIATDTQRIFGQMFETSRGGGLASQRAILEEWVDQARQGIRINKIVAETVATSDFGFAQVRITTDALASADESLAAQITLVEANFNGQVGIINTTLLALANADSALAVSISDLEVSFTGQIGLVNAAILAEQVARADGDSALAAEIIGLSADIGDVAADLSAELIARANGDDALAAQIVDLSADIGDVAADLNAESIARANGDGALASDILDLQASVGDVQADLVAESVARVDGDNALSVAVVAAEARANDATATGLWRITAGSAPGGVTARFEAGVRVTTGDAYVFAGMYIDIVGGQGRIVFSADKFAIVTSGGTFVPFYVDGADVFINGVYINQFIASLNYVEDANGRPLKGFKDTNDGVRKGAQAVFGDISVYGARMDFGSIRGKVPGDEAPIRLVIPSQGDDVEINSGIIDRGPTYVSYDLTRTSPAGAFQAIVPIRPGDRWGACRFSMKIQLSGGNTSQWWLEFDRNGVVYKVLDINGVENTRTAIMHVVDPDDVDPWFEGYAGTDIWRFRYSPLYAKTVRYIRVPRAAIGARFWLWGAAGFDFINTTRTPGGPGGFVKFDHALVGGEFLGLMVGAGFPEQFPVRYNLPGYGGVRYRFIQGGTGNNAFVGGGGSFVSRGEFTRANLLGVAGGGGSRGPGGLTASSYPSGGNGSVRTDLLRCMGLQDIEVLDVAPPNDQGGGGGGYEGGGVIGAGGSAGHGRGGSNFVIGTATSVTNQSAAADGNGVKTTNVPPGTGEAAYEAGIANSTNFASGMIAVQFQY